VGLQGSNIESLHYPWAATKAATTFSALPIKSDEEYYTFED